MCNPSVVAATRGTSFKYSQLLQPHLSQTRRQHLPKCQQYVLCHQMIKGKGGSFSVFFCIFKNFHDKCDFSAFKMS